jgi:aromatic-L-amino-acid/L-tryptophan decarboxylase
VELYSSRDEPQIQPAGSQSAITGESMSAESEIDQFRSAGHALIDWLADQLQHLPQGPVFRPMTTTERAAIADMPLPESPVAWEELLRICRDELAAHPMGNGHPRFFGWVNSPPSPAGILGALAAAAINPSCAGGDHAATYLEQATTRWLAELIGYPLKDGFGLLTSGASMASIVCLAAARQRAARRAGVDVREHGVRESAAGSIVLYASTETHSCIRKAVELLGIGSARLHLANVDGDGRIDVGALRAMIVADRAAGLTPFCLVGNAGTVNCGAVDPLQALADVAAEEGIWFHIDGAYGAFGILDPSISHFYAGMSRADSLALDPHKCLGVPVDCGCALVRHADDLRDTFSLVPAYLRTEQGRGFGGPTWFSEYSIEQTRPYRALRLWMTLARLGYSGVVEKVVRCRRLASMLVELIDADPSLELAMPVQTSIVAFHYRVDSEGGIDGDALTRSIVSAVQERGRAFVSGTVVAGREVLRACILNPETTEQDLVALLAEIHEVARRLRRNQ